MKILKTSTLPRVLSNIVVLRQKQLLQNETEDMSVEFIKYRDAYHKNDNVYAHTYSISELNAVGITNNDDIIRINNDSSVLRDLLSEAQLDMLLQSKRDYIINNYKERNRYVKMLMGEPYDDTEKVYLPDPVEGLDSSKSIDEFSPSEIKLIMVKGILDKLIKDNTSLGYLKYVYRKIPFMTTRTADIYGLLYVDTSTNDGYRFLERYEMTRLTFKRTMFNQMYYDLYPMYEDMMISFISASTLFDMMATEPYSIADFDFSSEDTLTSIYKTFSIPYLEKLPKQIKIALGERINRIILNKGSKSSLMDIIKAFGIDDIYQYVLHKEYKDTFDPSLTPEENYKLSFVKVRIDSNDIVRDVINSSDDDRIDYDKFVENDKRWGVEGDNLRSYILSKDFSYLRTKYIGVNETVDLMKDLTSSSQFMSYIFYNKDKMSNFKVKLERSLITVNIWELFVYAIVLIMNKNGYEDIILRDIEGVAYVHGLNTEYIITEGTLELFRKHLPDKYHRYIDGWVKLNEGLPMSEFMKTINDNTNLMKELKHIILNFDGPYSVYKYLCKIETLMNSMKRNDALGTLANYIKYSDFIKDSNHELFTYLELLRHSENASTNMSDELISIISDLNTVLELSNLSDDSLDNFAFVDKMKADEMDIIKISLFQIMAFLKTYTVDLKESDKVNQLYYTVKSIDNMFMTVYGNMYERSKTIDDITTITTYSKLISNVYISDHISHASSNLQIMSDKYTGHHNNYLLDIVTVNDNVIRTDINKVFDDKEYGDLWVENGVIKTSGIYDYIDGLSRATVVEYAGNAIITTPDNSFNCIIYKDLNGNRKIYTGKGYKNDFIVPSYAYSQDYRIYNINNKSLYVDKKGIHFEFDFENISWLVGDVMHVGYYSNIIYDDSLKNKYTYFSSDILEGLSTHEFISGYAHNVSIGNDIRRINACEIYTATDTTPERYRIYPPYLGIPVVDVNVPHHYHWVFQPLVIPKELGFRPIIPIGTSFPDGIITFNKPLNKHHIYNEEDNTDSIVLRTDTYFVNSNMSDVSDSIECVYSKWNTYDTNTTEDKYTKESYELSLDNVIRYLDYRNFLDTSDKWIDSKSSDRYFNKLNFTSSLFNASERYIQFDGYTSTIEHHGPLYPTNNFTMTLEFKVIENKNSTILFSVDDKFLVVIKENILSVQDGDNTYDVTLPFQINTDVIMTLVSHDNNTFDIYCNKIKVMTRTTTFDFVSSDTFALQNLAHGTLYKKNIWYRRLLIHSIDMSSDKVLDLQDVLIAFRNK